ncbi:3-hydroxyacyl-CoA dehydrogenase family protein [Yinghuangia seranimata]|uniref:3-hydroxyacyl-CoA dehydrogenase family protein n=1 Tax=Yinghuangia seranimata TaxID=408067 RepID=UPI00248A9AEC|nr:3-hydroxyacyl-CoA dehydrogenase family protein [Yinghuangia seranimata]MDI2130054.1 3-hydroxyacyl-CoA dehydrogenase family protein [Yinghuangia seranimata]
MKPDARVGVVGGGAMGIGIAQVFAVAGCTVTVVEPDAARAGDIVPGIRDSAARALARGKLAAGTAAAAPDRVTVVPDIGDLPEGLDLVVEAVPERLALKRTVLAAAERRAPRLLGTNTSGIGIGELGAELARPGVFIGRHFFNPVPAMPLLEIVVADATDPATVDAARDIAALIGKEVIVVRDKPGFATSRLGVMLGLEAIRMLEDGVASAADIDRAMELGYRHPMGPLRLTDLVGLDVRLDIARNLAEAYGPRFDPPRLLVDKVTAGELGRKSGRGFYDWDGGAA